MTVGLLPVLSDEQAMLLDATVLFIEAEFPMDAVRERADGGEGPDAGYLPAAARLGWLGMLAGGAHGGGSASGNGLLAAPTTAASGGPGSSRDRSPATAWSCTRCRRRGRPASS